PKHRGARMPQDVRTDSAGPVMASVAYVDGRRDRVVPIDEIHEYAGQTHSLLWIGLHNPDPELLSQVVCALGACGKNRDEMLEPHRRAKIVDYGNMVLVVAITVEVDSQRPLFGETQLLIGRGFLVTVR